jgi:hypothetical protein
MKTKNVMKTFSLAQFKKWGAAGGKACKTRNLSPEKAREMGLASAAIRALKRARARKELADLTTC